MDASACLSDLLGYLNLSDGSPSAAHHRNLNEYFASAPAGRPARDRLLADLIAQADRLEGTAPAFRDLSRARRVLRAAHEGVLPAYREHHRDLLAHLSDDELFEHPFFLGRVHEAVLAAGGEPTQEALVRAALDRLNDYVGHRPVAVLESHRSRIGAHERVRPIPLFFQGAGVARGRYAELIGAMLHTLSQAPPKLLAEAHFDLELLDELALDPRAYDHGHPVNQRPGYQFGEWDPHHLDRSGRYRRFVVRGLILEALLDWRAGGADADPEGSLFEAAAALAGTVLLASGVSGSYPGAHGSETTLGTLAPRVAKVRDAFYDGLLRRLDGPLGTRLRAEAAETRQPFGRVRQFLNRYVSRQRARQLQHDRLAQLFAEMGYPEESRRHSMALPVASVRMRAEIKSLLASGRRAARRGRLEETARLLEDAEDRLLRGIDCGALIDPWNILGFQMQFSLFPAPENSVLDPRVEQLVELVEEQLELFGALARESAASGAEGVHAAAAERMRRFADWWDQFATTTVAGVRRVQGREHVESALFVARVLAAWRQTGRSPGDLAFWKQYAKDFSTPQAYASVVAALLERSDHVSSMALLMKWLHQSLETPLEGGGHSFFEQTVAWLESVLTVRSTDDPDPRDAVGRFFDHLEANAEWLWDVPEDVLGGADPAERGEKELLAAAWQNVTYRDSADDGVEGETVGGQPAGEDADQWSELSLMLGRRLGFHAMLARLWNLAVLAPWRPEKDAKDAARLDAWANRARANAAALTRLIRRIADLQVPRPGGSQESILEFQRGQELKEGLLHQTMATWLGTAQAARAIQSVGLARAAADSPAGSDFESLAFAVERELEVGSRASIRRSLAPLYNALHSTPLLYVPLDQGGSPEAICRARHVREILRLLAGRLPVRGLFHETYRLLEAAFEAEQTQTSDSQQVTEFNLLFPVGFRAVVEALVDAMADWPSTRDDDEAATAAVGAVVGRFSRLWIRHVSSVRLSEIERRSDEAAWRSTIEFVRRYGRGLFTQRFMAFGNLRGILHDGVDAFLERMLLDQDADAPHPLVDELGTRLDPRAATCHLEFVLRVAIEHYDAYKDYNTTTTQSDYGENLHILLELLRVQAGYDRHRWALEPAYLAHGVLAAKGRSGAAVLLERAFAEETGAIADEYLRRLDEVERQHGVRLATVSDRIGERFVQPLRLDRMLALLGPAMERAEESAGQEALQRLTNELEHFTQPITGVGLEAPHWLRTFEAEVERRLAESKSGLDLARRWADEHREVLTHEEFQKTMTRWEARQAGEP